MTPANGEPTVVVAAPDDVAGIAADHILRVLGAAIEARGVAHWATTGGSNPADIYHAMRDTARRDAIDWDAVHVWWGDDRFVPRDHPLSNVKALDEILLDETHGIPHPARASASVPLRRGHRAGRGRRAVCGRTRGRTAIGRTRDGGRLAVVRSRLPRHGRRRPPVVGVPWLHGLRCGRLGDGHPGPDPHRAARRAGDHAPGDHRSRTGDPDGVHGREQGRDAADGARPGARRPALAGPARLPRPRDLDPRRGRRQPAP